MPSTSQITCSAGRRRLRIVAVPVASSAASIHAGLMLATSRLNAPSSADGVPEKGEGVMIASSDHGIMIPISPTKQS